MCPHACPSHRCGCETTLVTHRHVTHAKSDVSRPCVCGSNEVAMAATLLFNSHNLSLSMIFSQDFPFEGCPPTTSSPGHSPGASQPLCSSCLFPRFSCVTCGQSIVFMKPRSGTAGGSGEGCGGNRIPRGAQLARQGRWQRQIVLLSHC